MSGPVAVTGVTGFIGAQIAADLLQRGYIVHGTVRHNKPERLQHLTSLEAADNFIVFEADLLDEGSFDEAVTGCTAAIHVASPYSLSVKDAQKELIDPAVKGTRNILNSCLRAGVNNVVLTSSFAAITDGGEPKDKILTEDDWNTHSSISFLPYYYSKVVAERTAWELVEDTPIRLVTMNPPAVYGPSLVPQLGESASLIKQLVDGSIPGVIDFSVAVVDVRDVSNAHICAMESDTASGRYICCPDNSVMHIRDTIRFLNEKGYNLSSRDLTSPAISKLLRIAGYIIPGSMGQVMRRYIGFPAVPTNEKIKRDLDISFHGVEECVKDTIDDMIKWGHIRSPSDS